MGGAEYLRVVLEAGCKQTGTQPEVQDRQGWLGDGGVVAQIDPHGDHYQNQGITCPFLESEQTHPFLWNGDDAPDIVSGQFRKAEEINPGGQQKAGQNKEEDRP